MSFIKGVKFTEEHKRKLSLAAKNRVRYPLSEETKKKISISNTGKVRTLEMRLRSSEARIGITPNRIYKKGIPTWNKGLKGFMSGEKNGMWKGGITPINFKIRNSFETKQWRKKVFERDNYTCQHCGQKGGDLEADHIKPFAYFPELRFELSNGRTLCLKCHKKTETYSGRGFPKRFILQEAII